MRTVARLGQRVQRPLVEEGDSPPLQAPLTREEVSTRSTGVTALEGGWGFVQEEGGPRRPGNAYPLVLHGLLGLLQYPLHFF